MDSVELHQLAAQGESEHLEFKKTTGELHAGMETLCALLNGSGGKVLFGVTNSGRIVGQDVSDATLQEVAAAIRKIEPHAWIDQTRIPVADGREVLMLETTLQADTPYVFDGRPYQRIGPTTSRMPQPEYERRLFARSFGTHRWEEQPAVDYGMDGLDLQALDRLLDAAIACGRLERRPGSHEEALDKLRLRVEGRLVQAAVVLLAREVMPHYPQCTLRMARFRGINKLGDFLDQRQLYGHAFQLLDEAEMFLRRHVPVAGHFEPDNWVRQDRPATPVKVLTALEFTL